MSQQAFDMMGCGCQKGCTPYQLNLQNELSTAILLKIEADKDHFYVEIITGDETWVYPCTSMILRQNSSPNSGFHVDYLAQSNSSWRGL